MTDPGAATSATSCACQWPVGRPAGGRGGGRESMFLPTGVLECWSHGYLLCCIMERLKKVTSLTPFASAENVKW